MAADLDLQEIHDTMISVAREAGRMILEANPSDIDQGTKLNCKSTTRNPALVLNDVPSPPGLYDLPRGGGEEGNPPHFGGGSCR